MNLGHGGNVDEIKRIYGLKEEDIIDFSANINPLGISSRVKEAIYKGIDSIERYPDITYYELKREISKFENIDFDDIVLGNGAAEVIFNVVRGIKPKKALVVAPTFSEYEDALNSVECEVIHYILKDNYSLDEGFLNHIDKDLDIINLYLELNPSIKDDSEVIAYKVKYSIVYNSDKYKDGEYESFIFLVKSNDKSKWLLDPYDNN